MFVLLLKWLTSFYWGDSYPHTSQPKVESIRIYGTCQDNSTAWDLPVRVVALANGNKKLLGVSSKRIVSKSSGNLHWFDVQLPTSTNFVSFESEGYRTITIPVHMIGEMGSTANFRFHLPMSKLDSLTTPPITYLALCFDAPDSLDIDYQVEGVLNGNVPFLMSLSYLPGKHQPNFYYDKMLSGNFTLKAYSADKRLLIEDPITTAPGLNFKNVRLRPAPTPSPDKVINEGGKGLMSTPKTRMVYFKQSLHNLDEGPQATLDSVAQFLRSQPRILATVTGYTDNVGDRDKNRTLAEYRARAVAGYLSQKKVQPNQLDVQWENSKRQLSLTATEKDKVQNRRVVIEFSYK